jgi:hypothetical protein
MIFLLDVLHAISIKGYWRVSNEEMLSFSKAKKLAIGKISSPDKKSVT